MRRSFAAAAVLLAASTSPGLPAAESADATLNCVILPDEQVEVSSPVPGVIAEVHVRRSDRVVRGQVLARLESSVEAATLALARARAATDAEVRLRRVELGYDTQHRDRLQALHVRQAVSAQNFEDAERVAEAARLRVRLAADRQREAALERARAEAVLALKTLRSPIDGIVVERRKTVGEYVEDQSIVRLARLDPLRVEVIAPLALFGTVHEGMQVAIRPETDPGHERTATVTAVDAVADPGSGTFGIQLELPNPDLVLPAGIKCKGRLLQRIAEAAVGPAPAGRVGTRDAKPVNSAEIDRAPEVAASAGTEDAGAAPFAVAARATGATGSPGACLAFRGLDEEGQARALDRAAVRLGARTAIREGSEIRPFGYVVITSTEPSPGSQRALAGRLRVAGITDLALIARGDHAGRISLGAYNGPRSAERRRAALAALGFDTEVRARTRAHRAWRVEVRLPPGVERETARAALARDAGAPDAETVACEPLRTAAR